MAAPPPRITSFVRQPRAFDSLCQDNVASPILFTHRNEGRPRGEPHSGRRRPDRPLRPAGHARAYREGREGYCYFTSITSNPAAATLKINLRDFAPAGLAARKQTVLAAVAATQAAHPRAQLACAIEDSYSNIAASLGNDRSCLDLLERAFADLGVTPVTPLRGGTDGSALSLRGIPTPNYFTGGLNFHSRFDACRSRPSCSPTASPSASAGWRRRPERERRGAPGGVRGEAPETAAPMRDGEPEEASDRRHA